MGGEAGLPCVAMNGRRTDSPDGAAQAIEETTNRASKTARHNRDIQLLLIFPYLAGILTEGNIFLQLPEIGDGGKELSAGGDQVQAVGPYFIILVHDQHFGKEAVDTGPDAGDDQQRT